LGERFLTEAHYAPAKAFPFFQLASIYPLALARLGDFWLHSEPEHGVCERDPARARWAHGRAGEAGHGPSALAASDAWRMGRGGDRDYETAYYYLGLAWRFGPVVPQLALLEGSLRMDLAPEAVARVQQRLRQERGRPRRFGIALHAPLVGRLPRLVVVARRRHEGEAFRFEHLRHAQQLQIAELRTDDLHPDG
jgi:hypothetical protein